MRSRQRRIGRPRRLAPPRRRGSRKRRSPWKSPSRYQRFRSPRSSRPGCRGPICNPNRPPPGARPLHRPPPRGQSRSEEHTSELQSHSDLVCRLLLEKKKAQFARQQGLNLGSLVDSNPNPNGALAYLRCLTGKVEDLGKETVMFLLLMIRRPPRSTLFPYTTPTR